jgi:hypothetical protein
MPIGVNDPSEVKALLDGTIMLRNPRGYVFGFGAGTQREWIMIEP